MKKKWLAMLLIFLILPFAGFLSACGFAGGGGDDSQPSGPSDPSPEVSANVELTEYKDIAKKIIAIFAEQTEETEGDNTQALSGEILAYSGGDWINDIQTIVRNYENKESVASIKSYREAMFKQIFYIPIACGEVITESLGVNTFYGQNVTFTETGDNGYSYKTYLSINKNNDAIIIAFYDETYQNETKVDSSYNYMALNYVSEYNFNCQMISFNDNLKFINYTYIDSDKRMVSMYFDTENISDIAGNVVEQFEVLSSDGLNSYITTDKTTTISCKDIILENNDLNNLKNVVKLPYSSYNNTISYAVMMQKMESFVSGIDDVVVPTATFTVENGVLTNINEENINGQSTLVIPSNVTSIPVNRLSVPSSITKVIIPSTVTKLVIEKSLLEQWKNPNNTEMNITGMGQFVEVPYEYLLENNSIFNRRNENNESNNITFDDLIISDQSTLFEAKTNGNIYLNARTLENIEANNNTKIKLLVKIQDFKAYFGDNYTLSFESKNEEPTTDEYHVLSPYQQYFPNTTNNVAEKLYSNVAFYIKTLNITYTDAGAANPFSNMLTSALKNYYNLDTDNFEGLNTKIFELENYNIIINYANVDGELDNGVGVSLDYLDYYKKIKSLTVTNNHTYKASISIGRNLGGELESETIDNIILGTNITGLEVMGKDLTIKTLTFTSALEDIEWSYAKVNVEGNLTLKANKILLPCTDPYSSSGANINDKYSLNVSGDLNIESAYVQLGNSFATGDIYIKIDDITNATFRYRNVSAESVTLKLGASQSEMAALIEEEGNWSNSFASEIKAILENPESKIDIEYTYKFESKLKDNLGLSYDSETDEYTLIVRNNQTTIDLSSLVDADAVVTANTANDINTSSSPTVNLNLQNNVFYIFAKDNNSDAVHTYKINVYRNRIFKLKINANGGTFEEEIKTEYDIEENIKNYYSELNLDENIFPTKTAYDFKCWWTEIIDPEDIEGTPHNLFMLDIWKFDDQSNIYVTPTGDITVYAIYSPHLYSINYQVEPHTAFSIRMGEDAQYYYTIEDEEIILQAPIWLGVSGTETSDYTFGGWFTDVSFADEYKITSIDTSAMKDYTLYAYFDPVPWTIKYWTELPFEEEVAFTLDQAKNNPESIKTIWFNKSAPDNRENILQELKDNDISLTYPQIDGAEFVNWRFEFNDKENKVADFIAYYEEKEFYAHKIFNCNTKNCTKCADGGHELYKNSLKFGYIEDDSYFRLDYSSDNTFSRYHKYTIYIDEAKTISLMTAANDTVKYPYWVVDDDGDIRFDPKAYYEKTGRAEDITLYYELEEIITTVNIEYVYSSHLTNSADNKTSITFTAYQCEDGYKYNFYPKDAISKDDSKYAFYCWSMEFNDYFLYYGERSGNIGNKDITQYYRFYSGEEKTIKLYAVEFYKISYNANAPHKLSQDSINALNSLPCWLQVNNYKGLFKEGENDLYKYLFVADKDWNLLGNMSSNKLTLVPKIYIDSSLGIGFDCIYDNKTECYNWYINQNYDRAGFKDENIYTMLKTLINTNLITENEPFTLNCDWECNFYVYESYYNVETQGEYIEDSEGHYENDIKIRWSEVNQFSVADYVENLPKYDKIYVPYIFETGDDAIAYLKDMDNYFEFKTPSKYISPSDFKSGKYYLAYYKYNICYYTNQYDDQVYFKKVSDVNHLKYDRNVISVIQKSSGSDNYILSIADGTDTPGYASSSKFILIVPQEDGKVAQFKLKNSGMLSTSYKVTFTVFESTYNGKDTNMGIKYMIKPYEIYEDGYDPNDVVIGSYDEQSPIWNVNEGMMCSDTWTLDENTKSVFIMFQFEDVSDRTGDGSFTDEELIELSSMLEIVYVDKTASDE